MATPSDEVVAAFGATGAPVALVGGKGGTWRVDQVVLKPVEFEPETLWRAELLADLPKATEFAVARPIRTGDGAWVADGWEAAEFLPGRADGDRADDVLRAAIAFHAAIADRPRPAFLDLRDNPWDHGDRVAWGERPAEAGRAAMELWEPLIEARRPVELTAQVVHGDLLGNVLFAAGRPPAIIDWPVYWRPATWALAVAVADALCWCGAGPELVARWAHLPAWGQLLVRAVIYRIATDEATGGPAVWTPEHLAVYRPVVRLVAEGSP